MFHETILTNTTAIALGLIPCCLPCGMQDFKVILHIPLVWVLLAT